MLNVTDLSKTYRTADHRQVVFDGLDLSLEAGGILALVGASGSGKTTLLNLLSGIDLPDRGQVSIDGHDLYACGEAERTRIRRSEIGFVFQFFNLIPTLTVAENIALPLELTGHPPTAQHRRSGELLRQIGLAHTADRYPDTLSGGEQQRVAIARALAHRPRLLLADEPTGNLDEDTGEQVMDLLTRLATEQSTALLIVTHSARVAARASRVLRLRHGRLEDVAA